MVWLWGNRDAEHIEGVESKWLVVANSAPDSWFQLAIEQIYEDWLFSGPQAIPIFFGNFRMSSIIIVLVLHVRLLAYFIQILMKDFK